MKGNRLLPELTVSDMQASLLFYTDVLGFSLQAVAPARDAACIKREGAQLQLSLNTGFASDLLLYPFGQGCCIQIQCDDVSLLARQVLGKGHMLCRELEERWYFRGEWSIGFREFLLHDPDGYLLRLAEYIGKKSSLQVAEGQRQAGALSPQLCLEKRVEKSPKKEVG